jgi:hypothetical protein
VDCGPQRRLWHGAVHVRQRRGCWPATTKGVFTSHPRSYVELIQGHLLEATANAFLGIRPKAALNRKVAPKARSQPPPHLMPRVPVYDAARAQNNCSSP